MRGANNKAVRNGCLRHCVASVRPCSAPILPGLFALHCLQPVLNSSCLSYFPGFPDRPISHWGSWSGAILLHAALALTLLLDRPQVSASIKPARPIEVQLLQPARPVAPMQPVLPLKPKLQPLPQKTAQPQPLIPTPPKQETLPSLPIVATTAPVFSPISVAPGAVLDQAPSPVSGEPTSVVAVESARAAQSAPRQPEPLVAARFDANYLSNPPPFYPIASRRLGEAGVVRIRVYVGVDGQALKVELERSSGYARLDQSALDTVANWRFVPAHRGDTPVVSWVVVPLNFSLS